MLFPIQGSCNLGIDRQAIESGFLPQNVSSMMMNIFVQCGMPCFGQERKKLIVENEECDEIDINNQTISSQECWNCFKASHAKSKIDPTTMKCIQKGMEDEKISKYDHDIKFACFKFVPKDEGGMY